MLEALAKSFENAPGLVLAIPLTAAISVCDKSAHTHPARQRAGQRFFDFTPVKAKDYNLNAFLRAIDAFDQCPRAVSRLD